MKVLKLPVIVSTVFLTATLFLLSCSGSAPSIEDLKWRVVNRDDGTHRFEELSIFLRPEDPDGFEDLDSITVSAGDSGFIWCFPRDEWMSETLSGVTWYGLPGIIPIDGFRLPDGLYTATLEDKAGRKDERSFRPPPDRPAEDQLKWPKAYIANSVLHLEGGYEEGMLITRDKAFKALDVRKIGVAGSVDMGEAVWWEIWISLPETTSGFRLGPYPCLRTAVAE